MSYWLPWRRMVQQKKIQNSGKTCKKDKQINLKVKKNGLTCQKAKKIYGMLCFDHLAMEK